MANANNTPPSDTTPFVPVDRSSGERLDLLIDSTIDIPRGRKWSRTILDRKSGKRYRAWSKSCGLPRCLCDAYAEEIADAAVPPAEKRLLDEWCTCGDFAENAIFFTDGVCPCGEWKHHYHCPRCLGISQVG